MADYFTFFTAILAGLTAFWSYIQEQRLNKMCKECPFYVNSINKAESTTENK